jgi:integrase
MTLTAKRIARLRKKPGRYLDGGDLGEGLYLQITTGGASWILRYEVKCAPRVTKEGNETDRRERWIGLGSLKNFSLKEARARARQKRQLLADGIDPLVQKRADKAAAALAASRSITFSEAAKAFIDQHEKEWCNAKHRTQWTNSLKTYAYPIIGHLAVADIGTGEVLKVLEHKDKDSQRLWDRVPETASRVRGRIELVLDFAAVRGYRAPGDNPARWKGHLSNVLSASRAIQGNHPALAYSEMPAFMTVLREREGAAARALEFAILCAARTGEVIGARWDEIDFDAKAWNIPAGRIKGGREHRVALSGAALKILQSCDRENDIPFVFLGGSKGKNISDSAMAQIVKSIAFPSTTVGKIATVHGFRSSFKTWCTEQTAYPSELPEIALAHTVGNAVERAYRRSDILIKRQRMMEDWARFCNTAPVIKSNKVVPLQGWQG